MADGSIFIAASEFADEYDIVVDDLSIWEFINPSSSSDDDDEELGDLDDDFDFSLTGQVLTGPTKVEEEVPLEFGSPSSDVSIESLSAQLLQLNDGGGEVSIADVVLDVSTVMPTDDVVAGGVVLQDLPDSDDGYGKYGNNDVGDADYDDYDDGYGLDDELVPWGLIDKFEKQRNRKLGKRACLRMNKIKRLPYRGVYGKQGFGVQ